MTLIILQAADQTVLAVSSPSQIAVAARYLVHPVTAFHWMPVDPHKQPPGEPVWGWRLAETEVIE